MCACFTTAAQTVTAASLTADNVGISDRRAGMLVYRNNMKVTTGDVKTHQRP